MNTIGSHTALGDLVAYNAKSAPVVPTTTIADAQQTLAQTPTQILSALALANTSVYGSAPAADSLLGNVATSAGLNALSQINAGRSASTQISPFSSAADAVSFGQAAEAQSKSTLLASAMGSDSSSLSALTALYSGSTYSPAQVAGPQFEATA